MWFASRVKVYTCDCCGKKAAWDENWLTLKVGHQLGKPGEWIEVLTACSRDCANKIDRQRWPTSESDVRRIVVEELKKRGIK